MHLQKLPRGYVLDPKRQKTHFLDPQEVLQTVGLTQNMTFADFGCGGGYFTIPAATMVGEHGTVYAVDILKAALQDVQGKARIEGVRNIKYVWADLEILGSTKIAADSVDIVFVAHVFHQSGKQPEILKEAGRILKPEGKVVMVEWQKMKIPFGPPVGQRLAKDDAVRLAQSAGLQQISEFTPGHYHYGLVFGKSQADSSKSKEKK